MSVQQRNEEIATLLRQRANDLQENAYPGMEKANAAAARELYMVAAMVQAGDTYQEESIAALHAQIALLREDLDRASDRLRDAESQPQGRVH
jgi:hypothetical protein